MDMLRLAREVQRGANAVQGVEATLWQVNMAKNAYFKKKERGEGLLLFCTNFCLT